jgi:hypothetical protein
MPRDPLGAVGKAGVGGSGPGFGWARARRAGLKIFWHYLGETNNKRYYISSDHVAGVIALEPLKDAWDWSGAEDARQRYLQIIDEVCAQARSAPAVYVRLPRDTPPLFHLHSNGELWLALDDWPKPQDIMRIGRLPYSGPEAVCSADYVLDIARRERTRNAYVRVVRRHSAMFHFQVRSSTVITAESVR